MATSQTTNLQLTKYGAGTDNFMRTEYNGNMDKIDQYAGNVNDKLQGFNANNTYITSLSGLVTSISGKTNGDVLIRRLNADAMTELIGDTTAYAGVAMILKASANNAYFCAFNRGVLYYGNINLSNGSVNARSKSSANLTAGTNITLATGFNNKATRSGDVVTVEFAVTATADISSGASIATIPSGYRPSEEVRGVCYYTDGYIKYGITSGGSILVYNAMSSGKTVIGHATYIV